MAELNNDFQFNLTGIIGNVVVQKNNRIRIRKNQGKRNRRPKDPNPNPNNIV